MSYGRPPRVEHGRSWKWTLHGCRSKPASLAAEPTSALYKGKSSTATRCPAAFATYLPPAGMSCRPRHIAFLPLAVRALSSDSTVFSRRSLSRADQALIYGVVVTLAVRQSGFRKRVLIVGWHLGGLSAALQRLLRALRSSRKRRSDYAVMLRWAFSSRLTSPALSCSARRDARSSAVGRVRPRYQKERSSGTNS